MIRWILSLVSLFFISHITLAQQPIELGTIRSDVEGIGLEFTSNNSSLGNLVAYAFSLHGGFNIAAQGRGSATLDITETASGVKIDVLDTSKRVTASFTSNDGNKKIAALKASDQVVRHLTGFPGWFSGTIVFVSDRTGYKEIYYGDLLFQRVRQLTNHRSNSISPHISRDGKKILYTSYYKSGAPDLFMADLARNRITEFAAYDGQNMSGTFSPYGGKVAMILSSPGNPELYISDASGGSPKRMTNNRSIEASPAWSPDGSKLVLTSDQMGSPQLYMINSNGSGFSRLPTNISRYCAEPDWNPQYQQLIAFTASAGGGYQLALYDSSKQRADWLTKSGGDNMEPVWLPDGRHLLFTQRAGKSTRLHIMDTQSGNIVPLTPADFGNTNSPDFSSSM